MALSYLKIAIRIGNRNVVISPFNPIAKPETAPETKPETTPETTPKTEAKPETKPEDEDSEVYDWGPKKDN